MGFGGGHVDEALCYSDDVFSDDDSEIFPTMKPVFQATRRFAAGRRGDLLNSVAKFKASDLDGSNVADCGRCVPKLGRRPHVPPLYPALVCPRTGRANLDGSQAESSTGPRRTSTPVPAWLRVFMAVPEASAFSSISPFRTFG